jgi:hypothetical protein
MSKVGSLFHYVMAKFKRESHLMVSGPLRLVSYVNNVPPNTTHFYFFPTLHVSIENDHNQASSQDVKNQTKMLSFVTCLKFDSNTHYVIQ